MITPGYGITATERILPRLALDFTTGVADARVTTTRAADTATRFNASGTIEIVNADLPRFSFNPTTLVCEGQLIEEARTNLLLNSLIDGTSLATQSVTLSAVAYTLTFYGTGSVAISGGHSATVAGTGAFPTRTSYTFTPTAGSTTFTVTGTVSYAQLEAGSFATSFIPTAAISVLRNADVVTMTGTNFSGWYNDAEGTFVAEASSVAVRNWFAFSVVNSASPLQNYTQAFARLASNGFRLSSSSASVNDVVLTTTGIPLAANTPFKLGVAMKLNNFAFSVNAATPLTDTTANMPVSLDKLNIGLDITDATFLCGFIRKLTYYPQRVTNAELQAFTK